jgi:uncharacterized BrkB/YihY/UPF0761 family membrane protein
MQIGQNGTRPVMNKLLGGVLVLFVLASSLVVFIPAYLIRPFAPQTAADLDVSYSLRSASPLLTLAAFVLGLLCIFPLWRSTSSRLRKSGLVVTGVLLTALAVLARQNHFEWMFHPLPQPGYVEAAKASHVNNGDMVLSLEIGAEARAYPVPLMAYHHLVNTTVGREPIVATY